MFIAQMEQMRRYGVADDDIRAALMLARRLMSLDAQMFPDIPCGVHPIRAGGPAQCAQYVTMTGGGESYIIYVDHLRERLTLQAAGLLSEHAHRGQAQESDAFAWLVDAIAVHEVRHRLQEHGVPPVSMWTLTDLFPPDRDVMDAILLEVSPRPVTAREIDARIVEYLYIADRFSGNDEPAAAVRRQPR